MKGAKEKFKLKSVIIITLKNELNSIMKRTNERKGEVQDKITKITQSKK